VFPVILSVDRWLWPICFSLGCSYTAGPGAPKESLLWRGIWQTVHPSYVTSICLTFTTHTLVCFVYYAIDINYKITLQILQYFKDITCYLFVSRATSSAKLSPKTPCMNWEELQITFQHISAWNYEVMKDMIFIIFIIACHYMLIISWG